MVRQFRVINSHDAMVDLNREQTLDDQLTRLPESDYPLKIEFNNGEIAHYKYDPRMPIVYNMRWISKQEYDALMHSKRTNRQFKSDITELLKKEET